MEFNAMTGRFRPARQATRRHREPIRKVDEQDLVQQSRSTFPPMPHAVSSRKKGHAIRGTNEVKQPEGLLPMAVCASRRRMRLRSTRWSKRTVSRTRRLSWLALLRVVRARSQAGCGPSLATAINPLFGPSGVVAFSGACSVVDSDPG